MEYIWFEFAARVLSTAVRRVVASPFPTPRDLFVAGLPHRPGRARGQGRNVENKRVRVAIGIAGTRSNAMTPFNHG